MIEHRSDNPRVETFPGAACCTTLSSAKIFRAIMRWLRQQSKAAPLQALGEAGRKFGGQQKNRISLSTTTVLIRRLFATMKHLTPGFFPSITFEREESRPMYHRLYDWFRSAILTGQLRPGQNIPSTRYLAFDL